MNMKFRSYWLVALIALMFSQSSYALSGACQNELRELIVPPLQHVFMKKKDIRVEMEDHARGVYSVRLFVPADSPDNLNKQVSIGWVNLDTNTMQALDVTRDPDHPDVLKVDGDKYKNFVSMCISDVPKTGAGCQQLDATASKNGNQIPGNGSGRTVVGKGRLQFYSAPDLSCKMSGVFIVEADSVDAYADYGKFTSVTYLNPKSKNVVNGWVETDRLKPNGLGIAPRQP
ncbi:hypothetical protein [Paraburkholderia sp. BL21I4N1]|uniref:hypothetical protein n=1 Tax=Paraburkholderia sp. BL21I4N1 TaxID=1938801 RepID=UPI000D3F9120|nr:hypothetical protein [Paraburkholderia sp. BL21I4N1]PQV51890.1 hypothetical protein B0G83_10499 [Paraburkholderia sp. BL21I4N1]